MEPTGTVAPEDTGTDKMRIEPSEPTPDFLSLDDLVNDHDIVVTKEQTDKALLDQIGSQHVTALRPKLVDWVGAGKPHAYVILLLNIQPPATCSDGICRNLPDYITFCSGKSIEEHVGLLQAKLSGISVSFANIQGQVAIVVSP